MIENIEKVLERGERLDLLVDKTEGLQQVGRVGRRAQACMGGEARSKGGGSWTCTCANRVGSCRHGTAYAVVRWHGLQLTAQRTLGWRPRLRSTHSKQTLRITGAALRAPYARAGVAGVPA